MATDLNNLAGLLEDKNRLAEAEPLYRRALAIDEASYGPDHPQVARDLNNLAGLLKAKNRIDEAEPLFRRALAIFEASFGPDHPKWLAASTICGATPSHEPPWRGRAARTPRAGHLRDRALARTIHTP